MRDERFEVTVTALRQPVTALSLGGLRQRRCRPRNEIPRPSASVVPGAAHCAGGGSNGAAPAAGREQPAWRAPVFSPRDNGAARLHGRSGQLGSDREKHRAPAAGSPRRGRKSPSSALGQRNRAAPAGHGGGGPSLRREETSNVGIAIGESKPPRISAETELGGGVGRIWSEASGLRGTDWPTGLVLPQ
jgi:hypothetical protein